ncbi:MAG: CAP domain-containing protein [Microthrixaceae bacterium]
MALNHSHEQQIETANRPSRRHRTRRFGFLALGLALALSAGVLTSCESIESERLQVISEVNASRAAAGVPAVKENVALDIKADKWAQKMRNACKIWHSNLADGAPDNWRKLGENVGRGGSIAQVHVAYMNSPGHKANVLDPAFNQMGAAAVWGDCNGYRTVFTVHVFMKG